MKNNIFDSVTKPLDVTPSPTGFVKPSTNVYIKSKYMSNLKPYKNGK